MMENIEQRIKFLNEPMTPLDYSERRFLGMYMGVDPASVYDCSTCNNCGSGDCGDCCSSSD